MLCYSLFFRKSVFGNDSGLSKPVDKRPVKWVGAAEIGGDYSLSNGLEKHQNKGFWTGLLCLKY